jgi:uncharacterized protein (UPF0332 family)
VHDDLLKQAQYLATVDARKPKQANLRRAVSSAYYAMFHYLIDAACRTQLGGEHARIAYRHVLGRAFAQEACRSFGGGTLKSTVSKGLPSTYRIELPIQDVASAFVELQQLRHAADYDLTERFTRSDVLSLLEEIAGVMSAFRTLRSDVGKSFFLSCLWAWKELANR